MPLTFFVLLKMQTPIKGASHKGLLKQLSTFVQFYLVLMRSLVESYCFAAEDSKSL